MVELIITVISYEKFTHYVQTERPFQKKLESNPQRDNLASCFSYCINFAYLVKSRNKKGIAALGISHILIYCHIIQSILTIFMVSMSQTLRTTHLIKINFKKFFEIVDKW